MTPAQMKETLDVFAATFRAAGCVALGEEISELANLFDEAGRSTIAKFVAAIEANWKGADRPARHPKKLKAALESVKTAFAAAKAATPTKDFTTVLRLFSGTDDQSTTDFVADARSASKQKKASNGRPKPLSAEEIVQLGQQLIAVKFDRATFDALLARCEKNATVAGLKAIATTFLGRTAKEKKKADIIAAIRNRQRQDELNSDRGEAQSKLRS